MNENHDERGRFATGSGATPYARLANKIAPADKAAAIIKHNAPQISAAMKDHASRLASTPKLQKTILNARENMLKGKLTNQVLNRVEHSLAVSNKAISIRDYKHPVQLAIVQLKINGR